MESEIRKFGLDRHFLEVVDLESADGESLYWHTRTGTERLAALELLRRIFYDYDQSAGGLQRVLAIDELGGS